MCSKIHIWLALGLTLHLNLGSSLTREAEGRIIYPTERNESRPGDFMGNDQIYHEGIPESLLIRLSQVANASEFLRQFVVPETDLSPPMPDEVSFSARRAYAAGAAEIAPFAMCRPEAQVVKLEKPAAGGVMLWPPCVRLRRCGGCCTSKLLACRPLATSNISITVLQVRYNPQASGTDAFESEGRRVVTLQQHDRCACTCKQTADECIPGVQEYRPAECRCVCLDKARALACVGPQRVWDAADCTCKCRNAAECSTGFFFNFLTCRCEVYPEVMMGALLNGADVQSVIRFPEEHRNSTAMRNF